MLLVMIGSYRLTPDINPSLTGPQAEFCLCGFRQQRIELARVWLIGVAIVTLRSIVIKVGAVIFKVLTTQHVLAVKDLEKSEDYFVGKLGFQVRFRVDGWVFLSLQSFHLMLGHCADDLSAKETNNHSYFAYVNCADIDDLYKEYKQRRVDFTQEVADKPWGLREFGIRTPEGHRIMFGEEVDSPSS